MLQEFFMGAVGHPKKTGPKGGSGGAIKSETGGQLETSFTSVEPSGFLESRVVIGK